MNIEIINLQCPVQQVSNFQLYGTAHAIHIMIRTQVLLDKQYRLSIFACIRFITSHKAGHLEEKKRSAVCNEQET